MFKADLYYAHVSINRVDKQYVITLRAESWNRQYKCHVLSRIGLFRASVYNLRDLFRRQLYILATVLIYIHRSCNIIILFISSIRSSIRWGYKIMYSESSDLIMLWNSRVIVNSLLKLLYSNKKVIHLHITTYTTKPPSIYYYHIQIRLIAWACV